MESEGVKSLILVEWLGVIFMLTLLLGSIISPKRVDYMCTVEISEFRK